MSVNKVILIGNAGRDPEVRYLDGNGAQGSAKVARFTLATSERYTTRSGETKENTEWHNIVCWRQSADVAEKYIRKGTQVYIEGKLTTRSWTDAQGVKKYQTEINVDTLQLLGRRPDGTDAAAPAAGQYQSPAPQAQPQYSAPAYSAPDPQPQPQYSAPAPSPAAPQVSDESADDLPF